VLKVLFKSTFTVLENAFDGLKSAFRNDVRNTFDTLKSIKNTILMQKVLSKRKKPKAKSIFQMF